MGSRADVASKPWSSPFWMAIMPSIRWGDDWDERGMVTLLQPELTRAALNDYRLGHILDALFAANLNKVFSAIALQALEVYAISTPWLHQDTTTIRLYGAYTDEPKSPEAPHPAYGH